MTTTFVPHSAVAYARTYRDALADAEALVASLSPEQFNWKPSDEEWSVAECLEHLNKIGQAYAEPLDAALAKGGPGGAPPFRYGFFGRQFIALMQPDSPRKVKTFGSVKPSQSAYEAEAVLNAFRAVTAQFIRFCKQADGLDLRRIRLTSPLLPVVRFQLGVYLEALGAHALRHLAQARRVTRHERFPR